MSERVPEGRQLAPVEPTPKMLQAGGLALSDDYDVLSVTRAEAEAVWSAMLAAAPQPAPERQDSRDEPARLRSKLEAWAVVEAVFADTPAWHDTASLVRALRQAFADQPEGETR